MGRLGRMKFEPACLLNFEIKSYRTDLYFITIKIFLILYAQ